MNRIFIYLFILFIDKIFIQDRRFRIDIFTEYIKTTTFQTCPIGKERSKVNFKLQVSNSKFQAETIVVFREKQELKHENKVL